MTPNLVRTLSAALVALSFAACRPPAGTEELPIVRTIAPKWIVQLSAVSNGLVEPAIAGDVAIVGGDNGLVGLNVMTGARIWGIRLPFLLPYSGLIVISPTLAVLVSGDGYVVFNPVTGQSLRTWVSPNPDNDPIQAVPQRLSDGRIVYASRRRQLLALSASTGRLDTLVLLPGDTSRKAFIANLSVFRDTIYAPVASYALRGAAFRNTVPYRFAVNSGVLDSLRPDPSDSASLTRWMHATEELLVSATDYSEPSWLGFDRATGVRRWKVPALTGSLGPSSQVAIVGDTLFGGGNDGYAYVIHLPSGRLLQRFVIPRGITSGVFACGKDVFFNVVGDMVGYSRDGRERIRVAGVPDGAGYGGMFAVGAGAAVIGSAVGQVFAFPCPPITRVP